MTVDINKLLSKLYHPELKTIDPGLDRVKAFLALIGSPHKNLPPVVHVAGTNGKGSLIAYLRSILETAGLKVHCYTSPHLVHFNERIIISGKKIDNDYLQSLILFTLNKIQKQPVTFFEATTAMAFQAFSQHPADIVLLETGMGGRLDATNVIDAPILTAITPVALDHCEYLGHMLAEVAGEKAAIIKQGVTCVVGRQENAAAEVINNAGQSLNSLLYRMNHEWQINNENDEAFFQSAKRSLKLQPSLAGAHQLDNAATAIACIDQLSMVSISDAHIAQGLIATHWPARLQPLKTGYWAGFLPDGMELWLDGGHNPHGAKALAKWLSTQPVKNVHVVCGMIKGKDSKEFLNILAPCITQLYTVNIPEEATSQTAEALQNTGREAGISAQSSPTIENALQTIAQHAKTPSIVCICGSLYLAGKVLAKNEGML